MSFSFVTKAEQRKSTQHVEDEGNARKLRFPVQRAFTPFSFNRDLHKCFKVEGPFCDNLL